MLGGTTHRMNRPLRSSVAWMPVQRIHRADRVMKCCLRLIAMRRILPNDPREFKFDPAGFANCYNGKRC